MLKGNQIIWLETYTFTANYNALFIQNAYVQLSKHQKHLKDNAIGSTTAIATNKDVNKKQYPCYRPY